MIVDTTKAPQNEKYPEKKFLHIANLKRATFLRNTHDSINPIPDMRFAEYIPTPPFLRAQKKGHSAVSHIYSLRGLPGFTSDYRLKTTGTTPGNLIRLLLTVLLHIPFKITATWIN